MIPGARGDEGHACRRCLRLRRSDVGLTGGIADHLDNSEGAAQGLEAAEPHALGFVLNPKTPDTEFVGQIGQGPKHRRRVHRTPAQKGKGARRVGTKASVRRCAISGLGVDHSGSVARSRH